MRTRLEDIGKLILPKLFVFLGLFLYIVIFYKITMQRGYYFGTIVACFPFIIIGVFFLLKNTLWSFLLLFVANYFVMGLMRYVYFPGGILMDIILFFCFTSLLIKNTRENIEWKKIVNPLTIAAFVWLLFCILELLNPRAVSIVEWASQVRGMAIYPIAIIILSSVLLYKFKHLEIIIFIWSVLTLIAAFKGYWQKNHGFDSAEMNWLYFGGGASTHLIRTGIRYFSFFTDAGNYGSSMGFSMVVFSIASFYIKNKYIKFYLFIVALSGGYGMFISGTRGALAVPFAGYAFFAILSKDFRITLAALFLLISTFIFLNYTTIGDNNGAIHRMRTAFDKNDASLNVRLENQKKLKKYMANIPFGTSIGFYGNKITDRSNPYYEISYIPSDSWYVLVWIETGIIGLTIYISLLILIIIIGGHIILFKIKDTKLRGILSGLLAGIFGMFVSAYGNNLLAQFPNCFLFYISLTLVYMGKHYDKELEQHEQLT